jgi:hypothetical protein
MARALPNWARRLGKRRVDPFTRASRDGLDLLTAPPYDMSEEIRTTLDAEVREMVQRLLPGAVDAYSRDALDDWIEARAEQLVARLDSEREERQAVWEALVGLAKEEATRRKSRYDVDLDDLLRAQHALEVAREALTHARGIGDLAPRPAPPDREPIRSTLGKVDIDAGWIPEQSTRDRAGGGRLSSLRMLRAMPMLGVDLRGAKSHVNGANGSAHSVASNGSAHTNGSHTNGSAHSGSTTATLPKDDSQNEDDDADRN